MKVIKLEDKLETGFRYRLDDLTIEQFVMLHRCIEEMLKNERESNEILKDTDSYKKYLKNSFDARISDCEHMLNAIENKSVVKMDCYRDDVEGMELEKIIKKYKKVK